MNKVKIWVLNAYAKNRKLKVCFYLKGYLSIKIKELMEFDIDMKLYFTNTHEKHLRDVFFCSIQISLHALFQFCRFCFLI